MANIEELQAWRDALQQARFSGTRTVEYGDKKIEYRSDVEMRQALADLDRMIAAAGIRPSVSQIRFSATKGL